MSEKFIPFSRLRSAGVSHSHAVLTEMMKCGGFPKAKFRRGDEEYWRLSDVVAWLAEPCRDLSDEQPWLNPTKSDWVPAGRGV
jgi:hypothetical protein